MMNRPTLCLSATLGIVTALALAGCDSSSDTGDTTSTGGQGAVGAGGQSSVGTGAGGGVATGAGGGVATGAGGGVATGAGGSTATVGVGGSTGSGTASTEKFSFFMASQAGMTRLANNVNGFGGDLRFGQADGLSGADEICRQLAEASMPGNGKTWRAFLSVTKGPAGTAVNAIDRIGEGPWYDRVGRVFGLTKAGLLASRPSEADAAIKDDFPNEDGVPNHDPGTGIIDNHNTLTGSGTNGTLGSNGLSATCQDWTSSASSGGKPRVGVSWPRGNIAHWISVLNEGGCVPGTTPGNGAQSGPNGTVGALGGYGGIYCFALTP